MRNLQEWERLKAAAFGIFAKGIAARVSQGASTMVRQERSYQLTQLGQ
jgi:hypothetical protein